MRGEKLAELVDGGAVEDQLGTDAGETVFAEQDGEEGAGARRFDAGFGEDFGDGGDGQARLLESALYGGAGLLFILFERDLVSAGADGFAFDGEVLGFGEEGIHEEWRRGGQLAGAEILLGDAGQERVLRVELADGADEGVAGGLEPGGVHEPVVRLEKLDRGFGDGIGLQSGAGGEVGDAHAEPGFANEEGDAGSGVVGSQDVEACGGVLGAAVAPLADIDDGAAADGDDRGEHADDEAVPGQEEGRIAENDARVGGRAGLQR